MSKLLPKDSRSSVSVPIGASVPNTKTCVGSASENLVLPSVGTEQRILKTYFHYLLLSALMLGLMGGLLAKPYFERRAILEEPIYKSLDWPEVMPTNEVHATLLKYDPNRAVIPIDDAPTSSPTNMNAVATEAQHKTSLLHNSKRTDRSKSVGLSAPVAQIFSFKSAQVDPNRFADHQYAEIREPMSWLLSCVSDASNREFRSKQCPDSVQGRPTELKSYFRDIDSDGELDQLIWDRCCGNGGAQWVYSFLKFQQLYLYLGRQPFLGMGADSAYLPVEHRYDTVQLATILHHLAPKFLTERQLVEEFGILQPRVAEPLEWLKICATSDAATGCPQTVQNRPMELQARRLEINGDGESDWLVVDRCCGNDGAILAYVFIQQDSQFVYIGSSPYFGSTAAAVYREDADY